MATVATKILLSQVLCFSVVCCYVQRPNILVILTDDQDITLGGLKPMKNVQKLIANKGVTFINAFVTTPICCPSRSSFLTGKYLHNHHTVNNSVSGGCSNTKWQQTQEKESFAVKLHEAGYKTFYAGKYLNQYGKEHTGGPEHVPPGWDWWLGLVGNSRYYNYTLSINGSAQFYASQYLTDVIKNNSLAFLQQTTETESFLMVLSPPAPHAPFTPAPEYVGRFKNVSVLRTPNFNVPVKKDKHWLLRMKPSPLPSSTLPILDHIYQSRWETLLSVDDMVESVIQLLEGKNFLNNTYIIFTSDHGYHIGQFGLPWDKRQPYEFDIRVPLLVRGPRIPHKVLATQPVLNIDLAPTITSIAGFPCTEGMDGKSFFKILQNSSIDDGRLFLIEYEGEGKSSSVAPECFFPMDNTLSECDVEANCKCQDSRNNSYTCIRHLHEEIDILYCEFQDSENFIEAYDLKNDPYQLNNIRNALSQEKIVFYKNVLNKYSKCQGTECP